MKPLIVANWKMNPLSLKEAKALFEAVRKGVKSVKNADIVVCPPSVYLPLFKGLVLGAQNCSWEEEGAYTGEISPLMLRDIKVDYVVIGHSERRKYFRETDQEVNKKIRKAIDVGLRVVLCVGETAEERTQGKKSQVLKSQLENGLDKVTKEGMKSVIVAYEPIWAIGTGNNCSTDETMSSVLSIRQMLTNLYNRDLADKTKVLYGGSVNGGNSGSYIKESGANGLLVGGASLKADEFIKIAKSAG